MYLPILRGRQFELLALQECVKSNILCRNIIPVLEPVKVSSTFVNTVDTCIKNGRKIAIILNPQVGSWIKEIKKESNAKVKKIVEEQLADPNVVLACYVTKDLDVWVREAIGYEKTIGSLMLLFDSPEFIDVYDNVMNEEDPLYNLIPDKGDYRRRIRRNRVVFEDHFPKKTRNIDYIDIEDEFFSSDHLYYLEDGYKGFSDYSVVGKDYSETGFAPYAVAIHIAYFDEKKALRIRHFVSTSNDDISDPAGKFAEATAELVKWNETMALDTKGIQALESAYRSQTYPGLGVVKKYSIMHHLELISRYLDGVSR